MEWAEEKEREEEERRGRAEEGEWRIPHDVIVSNDLYEAAKGPS